MLKAYADEHVHGGIVQALRVRGMDIDTVQDRGRDGTPDDELLVEAFHDQRIMLTNDTDFLALSAALAARNEPFAPIFFWPQNRRRIGDVVRSVIRAATTLDYASACSRVHFL